jgi:two-component system LytT family sensor kinase
MNKLLKLFNLYFVEVIIWCLYISVDYTLAFFFLNKVPEFYVALYHYLLNIAFFYLLAEWTFPWALNHWRLIPYRFPVIILMLVLYVVAKLLIDYILGSLPSADLVEILFSAKNIAGYLYRFSYFAFSAIGYYYIKKYHREREDRYSFMEKQFNVLISQTNGKNKEAHLRDDIILRHPDIHFVFSTLSYLHTRLSKKDLVAAKTIAGLSELMRYPLRFSADFASSILSDELYQLKTRLEVKRLMGKGTFDFSINIPKQLLDRFFPAGILMPIIVGIMKTGKPDISASLDFALEGETLLISFSNFKMISSSVKFTEDLEWVKERLTEEYGSYAQLEFVVGESFDYLNIRIDRFV